MKKNHFRHKSWLFLLTVALVAVAFFAEPAPAWALTVTNTFYGTIIPTDSFGFATTDDTGNYFGGGSLLGDPFTLAFTTTADDGANFVTGSTNYGGYYYPPNPITAALTINNDTQNINDSSDGFYYGGNSEYYLQAFIYNSGYQLQTEGVVVDIIPQNLPATDSLTTKLPGMLLSNNDFVNYDPNVSIGTSVFYDGYGEYLALKVNSVNAAPVPEPATFSILGLGILGVIFKRKKIA
jgi:PEP-CTERM motif